MGQATLWLEALAIGLIWVTLLASLMKRTRSKLLRIALALPMLVPLVMFGVGTAAAVALRMHGVTPTMLGYAVALTLCFLIGAVALVWIVLRSRAGAFHPFVLLAALVIMLGLGRWTVLRIDAESRARGEAASAAVFAQYKAARPPMPSEADNAAPLYEQAFVKLAADIGEGVNNPPTGNSEVFDPKDPATHAYLARQKEAIQLLHAAAARPVCRFKQDDNVPSLDGMHGLNTQRHAANVLWLHAKQSTADGDVAAAMRDIDSIFRLSRHLSDRPLLVSGLVAVGINGAANAALMETLPAVRSEKDLQPLNVERLTSLRNGFAQVLRGEERFGLSLYNGDQPGLMAPMEARFVPMAMQRGMRAGIARAFLFDSEPYIEFMQQMQSLADQRYIDARPQIQSMKATSNSRGLLVSILVPSVARTFEVYARSDIGDAVSTTAVALTRYRLKHGSLPGDLKALVPGELKSIPIDPYDGQPIRMAMRGEDRVLYSVGPDGVDDGGAVMDRHEKGDIGFTLRGHSSSPATLPTTQE